MLEELLNIEESEDFKNWINYVYNDVANIAALIDKKLLINGLCADLAIYLNVKYNVDVYQALVFEPNINSFITHYFVQYTDGKFYDGWNREGVFNILDLEWFKFNNHYYRLIVNLDLYFKDENNRPKNTFNVINYAGVSYGNLALDTIKDPYIFIDYNKDANTIVSTDMCTYVSFIQDLKETLYLDKLQYLYELLNKNF